jgi:two-component system sensor histidine kinase/response regulator
MTNIDRFGFSRLLLSTLIPLIAFALQWEFWVVIKPYVWFLFFPAVFFSSWIGGLYGGLIATALSTVLVWYFFIPLPFSFRLEAPMMLVSIGMFVFMGGLFSFFHERLKQAKRQATAALDGARETNRHLSEANDRITRLYEKTRELDELKTRFFANVSHELRTPLTLILGPAAKLLTEDGLSADQRRTLETIERSARMLYRHVGDLLDVAKLEAGRMNLRYAETDLARLVRFVACHFESLAEDRGIRYAVECPAALPAQVDGEKCQRILLNLISNAFKFTPDGGAIALTLLGEENRAVLRIRDNGPGVPKALGEAIFERFRQAEDGAARPRGGTGLGLAIVREFTELHGGRATVADAPGGGALFTVTLPLLAPPGTDVRSTALDGWDEQIGRQALDELERKTAEPASTDADADAPLVLVVEDNADMNAFVCEALGRHYRIATAFDGEEGLAKSIALKPDLIVSDLMMPRLRGDRMVEQLRRRADTAAVPVVMLTARADDALRVELLKSQVQDYLGKPFAMEELLARVNILLAERRRFERSLKESDERINLLLQASPNAMLIVAADGRIEQANRQAERLFDYPPGSMSGTLVEDLLPQDLRERHRRNRTEFVASPHPRPMGLGLELYAQRRAGERFPVEISLGPVSIQGRPYTVATVVDLTERRQVEAELQAYRHRLEEKVAEQTRQFQKQARYLRTLIDNFPFRVWLKDQEGRYLTVNRYFADGTPYTEETLPGRTDFDLWPTELAERCCAFDAEVMTTRRKKVLEERIDGRDGPAWIETFTAPVLSDDGSVLGTVGFSRDITERKQAEEKIAHLAAIVESSDDAIIGKTLDGIVISWNAGAERIFGYTAEEVLNKPLLMLFPPEKIAEESETLARIAQGETVEHFETERFRKDGQRICISTAISPIRDGRDDIVGASTIARDITDHKRIEEELHQAKRIAESANRAKSEFLANMSHEIRTPMNAILGLLQLVQDTELTARQRDYLSKVQAASTALLGILNDILDYSKIEAGRLDLERVAFDPEAVLQSMSDLFAIRAEEKGLELFIEVAPEVPKALVGDPLRLKQVLGNLLSNAIKFTERGEIDIKVDCFGPEDGGVALRFAVRDTGIGLSKDEAERLFQSFTQADMSITRKYGGTGLGLTICRQLVKLMGGDIAVSSAPGAGATFAFTARFETVPAADRIRDLCGLRAMKTLVVDDQETSLAILRQLLESWRFEVATTLSGESALCAWDAAERAGAPFELLLLDWQMPGLSGLDVARAIQERSGGNARRRPPLVIMVTAYSKEQLLMEAGDLPLDAILTKPVMPSGLLGAIVGLHHAGGSASAPAGTPGYRAAAETIRGARVLLVEDNEINQLVAQEFLEKLGLRVVLARHGGEAVEWVRRERFDAVLMDLQMPEMDGFEATRRIRALPAGRNLPIIAMTAAALRQDQEACRVAGMNAHVAKPIDPEALVQTLLLWIEPGERAAPPLEDRAPPARDGEWEDLAEKLPDFAVAETSARLGGRMAWYRTFLAGFAERHRETGPAIRCLAETGDSQSLHRLAHALSGEAGTLGIRFLQGAADELARATRAAPGGDLAALAEAVAGALERALGLIAGLGADPAAAPATAPDRGWPEQAPELLAALGGMLVDNNFDALEYADRLEALLTGTALAAPFTPIAHAVRQLAFDEALARLRQLAALQGWNPEKTRAPRPLENPDRG